MSKAYKSVEVRCSVADALDSARTEIQGLSEEMGEWRDNMGDNDGLRETEKFQMVEEAADTLEIADADSIEEPPDGFEDVDVSLEVLRNKSKRRSDARWARLANAQSYLEVTAAAIASHCDELEKEKGELEKEIKALTDDDDKEERDEKEERNEEIDRMVDEGRDFIGEIENVTSEIEGVEFPGMFG